MRALAADAEANIFSVNGRNPGLAAETQL